MTGNPGHRGVIGGADDAMRVFARMYVDPSAQRAGVRTMPLRHVTIPFSTNGGSPGPATASQAGCVDLTRGAARRTGFDGRCFVGLSRISATNG
ncbi:hypothetical protein [Burkholderia stabilis]|uniref:hypothetical protein n=1 Tax=Burkholderia stabilis TaxID=95485 RepID=UPI001011CD89|nr:hypothetical protein [Burkholderia stabilis]